MTNPFFAIFQNEVLLNSKRVAPYVMALVCGGNALLWWGWGPATGRGWATNADFLIAGMLPVYSFMTLPLFTVLLMADPVIRDVRTGIDPLIFSKPISRAQYLLGKFFGNFFVLVCCQAAFVLTLFVLQAFHKEGMVVQEAKVVPYIKHFLVFVAISHLFLAAVYFTIGTLTRNAKIVYGLGVSFYPVYITYQAVFIKSLPPRWHVILDPLVMNYGNVHAYRRSAEWLNQLVVSYDAGLIVNRVVMLSLAAICLLILYARFSITDRSGNVEKFSVLNLSTEVEIVYFTSESLLSLDPRKQEVVPLPKVEKATAGIGAYVSKLISAVGTELRLLRAERSL